MNTILITVDSLRADHLGQYGYDRDTMPVLDRIAENGTIFRQAFSNGPYTRTSIPSIHTSRIVGYNKIEGVPTIASVLSKSDIKTGVVGTRTGWGSIEHGLGFDEYLDLSEKNYAGAHRSDTVTKIADKLRDYPLLFQLGKRAYLSFESNPNNSMTDVYASAEDVTDRAIKWIQNNKDDQFFLWIHYMEAHRPYGLHDPDPTYAPKVSNDRISKIWSIAGDNPDKLPVEDYKLLIDQYDSNIRYCSRHLERLFNKLQQWNILEKTNTIFTSDHGEEFYEHGMFTHHNLPYDELIHVPLIMNGSNIDNRELHVDRHLIDVSPTILDLHNIDEEKSFNGQNLFSGGDRKIIAVGSYAFDGQVVAGRWDGWKYIKTEQKEYLFDLDNDKREQENVISKNEGIKESFTNHIPDHIFDTSSENLLDSQPEVNEDQLKALGYKK